MKRLAAILVVLCFCGFSVRGAAAEAIPLVFVPEMEDLPLPQLQSFAYVPKVVATPTIEAFRQEWNALAPTLEPLITPPMLVYLSRWARQETTTAQLKPGWINDLPMKPTGTVEKKLYLFSQEVSEGYPLPSRSPIVFRHLQLYAEFDPGKKKINRVLITIRGWREE